MGCVKKIWLLLLFAFPGCAAAQNYHELDLCGNWMFRRSGEQQWLAATVPGTVHTDLLANKIISDPYYGSNEKSLQWIENCDWQYRLIFDIPDSIVISQHADLVFDGLDTYARVYLNDSLILQADNMFRSWRRDCRNIIKQKNNELLIVFGSAVNSGRQMAKMLPYELPGGEKVFTRKAQYQYGWDWGPRFVTCGIWRPVRLEVWDGYRVTDVHITTNTFNNKKAELTAVFSILSDSETHVNIEVENTFNPDEKVRRSVSLIPGINDFSLAFTIAKPVLWWCNGQGEPFLYPVKVCVNDAGSRHFEKIIPYGIRKIELLHQADSIGESFLFRLNGKNIFAKGANYIPPDNFMPRIDSADYAAIIDDAVSCNMNMLRVWGGGNYENDIFYRLCDEQGILVWQDLMFACAMYPGDSGFVNNVRSEVTENIMRLRNHPCIALWCGNNEISEGWQNWGWQKQYSYTSQDSSGIWNDYLQLFHKMIPELIARHSPETAYIPGSPEIGWGHRESITHGDSHYWGVWWGMEPFDVFEKKVPRFMSEFGFQGMPDMATIRYFTDSTGRRLLSEDMMTHQKHPTGYETINTYMAREYPVPETLDDYVYISQLLQAGGMKRAFDAQRSAIPRCMGSLYWQMNDCWPVVSWAGRDYFGRWKALQYIVKKAFSDPALTMIHDTAGIKVYIIADTTSGIGTVNLSLLRFDGTLLWSRNIETIITPGISKPVYEIPDIPGLTDSLSMRQVVLKATLNRPFDKESNEKPGNLFFFTTPKNLILQKPDINLKFTRFTDKLWEITLETSTFAKNVRLSVNDTDATFSDNYFDILPNQIKKVTCIFTDAVTDPGKVIRIKSLYDIK